MTLKQYAQKLRAAAEAIEEVIGAGPSVVNENPKVASAIRKDIRKGRTYNGKHWSQTARGRALMSKRSKAMWAERRAKAAEAKAAKGPQRKVA